VNTKFLGILVWLFKGIKIKYIIGCEADALTILYRIAGKSHTAVDFYPAI